MGKKKEAAKLAAREAEILAELAAREAAKKAKGKKGREAADAAQATANAAAMLDGGKKAKAKRATTKKAEALAEAERVRIMRTTAAMEALANEDEEVPAYVPNKAARKSAREATIDAADRVLNENSSDGARDAASDALAAATEAGPEETDEQIKARVKAKRAARAAATAPLGGVTSSPEALDAIMDPTPEKVEKAKAAVDAVRAAAQAVAEVVELTPEMARDGVEIGDGVVQRRKKGEKRATVAEVVETEKGREFVVGERDVVGEAVDELFEVPIDHSEGALPAVDPYDFAKPSEAPKLDFEENGNGQYKVRRPSDGKIVGYTRVTTYIANLEDRTNIEKWKLRMLLEGVAVNDHPDGNGRIDEPVVATMRDLIHRRDVAIAKARKADRKGRLVPGELATYVDGAWSEFKKAVNELAESLLTVGGAHEKRTKGTDIHALCELADREGIDAVGDLLVEGKITPQDLADVEAYLDAMKRAGIRVIDIERPIVNHELKVAGRLDRTALVKLPGAQRASKMVVDIKTGRIDLSAGKLAQQLEMYAGGRGYDLDTHEEEDLKLSRTKAVVVHLPAGTGTCFIYPVDLTLGRKGNRLSGEVRAWRNEGKRAVDYNTDLAGSVRS